jgi:hypothetical protein
MFGEPQTQFSLTRAVLSTGGREKRQIPMSVVTVSLKELEWVKVLEVSVPQDLI